MDWKTASTLVASCPLSTLKSIPWFLLGHLHWRYRIIQPALNDDVAASTRRTLTAGCIRCYHIELGLFHWYCEQAQRLTKLIDAITNLRSSWRAHTTSSLEEANRVRVFEPNASSRYLANIACLSELRQATIHQSAKGEAVKEGVISWITRFKRQC